MFSDHITKLNQDVQAALDGLSAATATFNAAMQKAHSDFVASVQADMSGVQTQVTALEQQIMSILQIAAPTPPA